MGKYYTHESVVKSGKKPADLQDFKKGDVFIPKGHRAVAVMDNGINKVCADVTKRDEFDYHYSLYYKGMYLSIYVYIVPEDKLVRSS